MNKKWVKWLWPVLFGFILSCFTLYVLADTFLIERVYMTVDDEDSTPMIMIKTPEPTSPPPSEPPVSETGEPATSSPTPVSTEAPTPTPEPTPMTPIITDYYYEDDNIKIELELDRYCDTDIHIAYVTVSSLNFMRVGFANRQYGRNIKAYTSVIAEDYGAILALDGDNYGARENGYVIRNGKLYRSSRASNQQDLVIYSDGTFDIINEKDVTAEELLNNGAWHVFCFGPGLVDDGNILVTRTTDVEKRLASNQRAAIGMIEPGKYVLVCSDGRIKNNDGLTLYQLAEYLVSKGVTVAYNLDGGGSASMIFNGKQINVPTSDGYTIKERGVSDIVYIG